MSEEKKTQNLSVNAINSREEAKKFDELLLKYSETTVKIKHPNYLPLEKWWVKVQGNVNDRKIFNSIFDLKLALVLLNYDIIEINAAEGKIKRNADDKLLITEQPIDSFFGRVDLHRSANAYIIRYRAIFDKLMGLMVLLHSPDDYSGFYSAKSRKKAFRKFAEKHPEIFPENSVDNFIKSLTIFDEGYRTSEVHGAGTLKKYSFSFHKEGAQYFGILQIDSWNWFIEIIRSIDQVNLKID